MKEKNKVLQKIIEKPKQTVINFTTMVKSRIIETEEKKRQQREICLTTPPKQGEPLVKYENNLNYGSSSQFPISWKYTWNPENKRWDQESKIGCY
ncbi:hypothetical protein KKD37_02265 [Patescibacteria group bacterium]|nr:hypothetical protein [Patescibacteria group bacterium]